MKAGKIPSKKMADDYKTLKLEITVKNLTSGVDLPVKGERHVSVSEFHENGLILSMPAHSCSMGHHLMLYLHLSEGKQDLLNLSSTAKVTHLVPTDADWAQVTVQLIQYEQVIWDQFLHTFHHRQTEIQELLESLKGMA